MWGDVRTLSRFTDSLLSPRCWDWLRWALHSVRCSRSRITSALPTPDHGSRCCSLQSKDAATVTHRTWHSLQWLEDLAGLICCRGKALPICTCWYTLKTTAHGWPRVHRAEHAQQGSCSLTCRAAVHIDRACILTLVIGSPSADCLPRLDA